jgi:cell division protease FtsH
MVCEWGMSDTLGPLYYSGREEHVFLGREIGKPKEHSEHTQVEIDREVRRIIEQQYQVAHGIVSERLEVLHSLAKRLIEAETLDGAEIDAIVFDRKSEPVVSEPSGEGESQET